jgi:PTH1 family peptidyl-tRNA hydrolase
MQNTWLIVGLGNPGREYRDTRHNAGYMVLDALGRRWGLSWSGSARFRAQLARVRRAEKAVILCRPVTFMNASGEAVGMVAAFYRVSPKRTLVVVDDADLVLGQIRLRPSGSSGGHHGLESVERHLATREYARLRLGIGRQSDAAREITDYVLAPFGRDEFRLLEKALERACDQVECWLAEGVQSAMNRYNGMVEE